MPIVSLPIMYLGIPLDANARKETTWKPILEKIEKRLVGWKTNLLSRARRLVLIKLVLNSLPMYYLNILKLPKKVAKKIVKLQRNFFWSPNGRNRGIPLISWKVIQRPKELGGLGVRDLVIKTTALLFK